MPAMDCWRQGLRQKKISLGFSPALRSDTDIVDRNGKKKTKFRFSIIWILTFTISTKEFPIPNHRIVPNDIHPDPKKIRSSLVQCYQIIIKSNISQFLRDIFSLNRNSNGDDIRPVTKQRPFL